MKKIINNLHYIIILIVGLVLVISGLNYHIDKINFNKNSIIVDAKIYQLSNTNGVKTVYLRYSINNKIYKTALATEDKNIKMGNKVKIYCNKNNLEECTNGKISNYGIGLIILGIIILSSDIFVYVKNKLK